MSQKKESEIKCPLQELQWRKAEQLTANDYNPNVVQPQEMKLLELSIRKHGCLQPVLIDQNNCIIDGFHRWTLSKQFGWRVPCVVFTMTEQERKLLTIRINRAKGTHVALRMADIIKSLLKSGLTQEYIAEQIGASKFEVTLLGTDSVFTQQNVQDHKYSLSWIPKNGKAI